MKRLPWILTASTLTLSFVVPACAGDDNEDTTGNADETAGDGDGDPTGDGDGDGDPSGDGDGDPSGDGDGDPSGDGDGDPVNCAGPDDAITDVISGDINEDTTWTCDKVYGLAPDTQIFVNGSVLTIEAGTYIKGSSGSALVIEKDSRIEASGTENAPIVFTSVNEDAQPSDWGGLVLLGEAIVNLEGGVGQAEGFVNAPSYGGNDAAHNCGTLEYVRVEYGGFPISEGNELNGITFFACGTETTVHHVMSKMGSDDGIELFGGGFDMDHIIVSGTQDDSLDIDQGFSGTIQHVFVHQDPSVGDNCLEISNQGSVFTATPHTAPVICNATCVGSGAGGDKSKGFTFKEGTEGYLYAVIFVNQLLEYALLADESTFDIADAGDIEVKNSIFFGGMGNPAYKSGAMSLDNAGWEAWILDPANANQEVDPELADATWGSPDGTPAGDVSGDGTVGAGCEATNYIGAIDPAGDNWTAEAWVDFTP